MAYSAPPAVVNVNPLPSQITTNNYILSGTSNDSGTISVSVGGYSTFNNFATDGIWEVLIIFSDLYDGQTLVEVTFTDTHGSTATTSFDVDFLAENYEDEYVIISPNPRRQQAYSIMATVQSKDPDINLQVSVSKDTSQFSYVNSGYGILGLMIPYSAYLSVILLGVTQYTFYYNIDSSSFLSGAAPQIETYSGIQFSKNTKCNKSNLLAPIIQVFKIDNNKYFRYIK
jgi:hypothetical protein